MLEPGLRYFNAANIGPAFRGAVEAQARETAAFQADPSRERRERYVTQSAALRARLARRLNAAPEEIALVRNASEGNSVAVLGLDLKPGDEVIVTDHNHQSTLDSWHLRARRQGLVVRTVATPFAAADPAAVVAAFAAAVTPRTRAIFLSHMTNVTGLVLPVADIARLARAHGAWLHVDAAQTFGWLPTDLAAIGCDSWAASTHKWLLGPLEGGVLYVRRDRQDRLSPLMLSHGYWIGSPAEMETAQRYEILGQRDDPKLAALAATLDAHDALGEAVVERMVRARAAALRAALARVPGARLVGSAHPALAGPVVTAAFAGQDVPALRRRLWRQARIATAEAKAGGDALVRFSPHLYNSEADIAAVTRALDDTA
ncbi:MAG: aminotransferase class V-fold PLP-dependent enzyme [Sphingomonas fennica]